MQRYCLAIVLLTSFTAFGVDTLGKTSVRTNLKTDVQVQVVDQAGSTLMNVQSNNTAIGAGGAVQELSGLVNSSLPTYTAGNIGMPSIDTSGRTYVTTDAAANLRSNITQIGGTALALGQTTMSASIPVTLASNQSTIATSVGAPSGTIFSRAAPVNIAAAATTAIVCKSGLAISQPTKPYQMIVTGAAMARCTLRFNDNTVMTNFADVITSPTNPTVTWQPPTGFAGLTTSATVTTLEYEANCTNFDSAAADFGCSVIACQSASGC